MNTANYISFQDPDYAPGAIEREANAHANLYKRQLIAVENLNALVEKYKLGNTWKVDRSSSICGDFIMPAYSKGNIHGSFKTTVGKVQCQLSVFGRYEDLVLVLEGVSLTHEDKQMCLSRINFLLPNMYPLSVQSENTAYNKSVSFHFGSPCLLSDEANFKGFKKVLEFIKKEVPFKR